MSDTVCVTGVFTDEETCARGILALRDAGLGRPRAFSPFASERIQEALHMRHSPVRSWVLFGGLSGCASGFLLTIGLSMEYPRVTAGMPIVSIPPFVIIAFELTILFGALSGLIGFLLHGGFPRFEGVPGYQPDFSNDRFGIVIECAADERRRAERSLLAAGAVEVIVAESGVPQQGRRSEG